MEDPAWLALLVTMSIDDWLDLNPCDCHARCVCDEARRERWSDWCPEDDTRAGGPFGA